MSRTTGVVSRLSSSVDRRLATYLASAGGLALASHGQVAAQIVSNSQVQPFGINGEVNIDFNMDGQVDFQIDHDRVNSGGADLDYLQIDKNDVSSAANPLPIDGGMTFDLNGTVANDVGEAKYVTAAGNASDYPAALAKGTLIGPGSSFDFQESDNFSLTNKTIRANRLIDEDAGKIDMALGGLTAGQIQVPTNGPNFVGLGGEVAYLGLQLDFNGSPGVHYGWIGVHISNEADATGEVVGWGYNATAGAPIAAGQIPEPTSLLLLLCGLTALWGRWLRRRGRGWQG